MHKYILLLLTFSAPVYLLAQASGVPLQSPTYHLVDRLQILTGNTGAIHTEVLPYSRQDVAEMALSIAADSNLTRRDKEDLQYIFNDNNEWVRDSMYLVRNRKPILKTFYATPANFFEVNSRDFILRVNPMFNFNIGQQQDDAGLTFMNQRGLEVRGEIDRKVFFYTNLVESQARFPNYMQRWIDTYHSVPGAGFFKQYQPRIIDIRDGYDFNVAIAYLSFNISKHVGVQLGHGRNFIGSGYRSLLLSDVGNTAFYLKLNTRVRKFQYQNLFLELNPVSQVFVKDGTRIPKKYVAMHYLSYEITPRLSLGFFEATVFNRSQQFEFQYLNPVILYRTVEGMIGSPDNILIGFDGHWNLARRVQVYGQIMIDEFRFADLFGANEKGWWANKYGLQLGAKYINAFNVNHLDLQLEYNYVRPYTYSHYDSLNSYTHYSQPLAHPLWSNFKEIIGIVRYQPTAKLSFTARIIHVDNADNSSVNWGSNALLDNSSHPQDYGNTLGQGISSTIDLARFEASWMLYHNLYIDFNVLLRRKNSEDNALDQNTKMIGVGLRMNLWNAQNDF